MSYNKYTNKALLATLAIALVMSSMTGCGKSNSNTTESNVTESVQEKATTERTLATSMLKSDEMFTKRDLEASYQTSESVEIQLADAKSVCESKNVEISGDTITIKKEGTYVIKGSLSDGQIIVDTEDKVQLVLAGVKIENTSSAAIYVKNADKVFLTLEKDTKNTVTTSGEFAENEDGIDGAIYSKDDLTINGEGALTVSSTKHGVVSKDDLKIASGNIHVTAASKGLSGKDSVRIADGTISIEAGSDGIHSSNADKGEKGYIYIGDGEFSIKSGTDGMDASYILQIEGGSFVINAGKQALHADNTVYVEDGEIDVQSSYEGIEATAIQIDGGDIKLVSDDDGLNASNKLNAAVENGDSASVEKSKGGNQEEMPSDGNVNGHMRPSGDMPSNEDMRPSGDMPSNEDMRPSGDMPSNGGMKPSGDRTKNTNTNVNGEQVQPEDKTTGENPSQNRKNDTWKEEGGQQMSENSRGEFKGGMPGNMDYDSNCSILITGGTLTVVAKGDGIDSNGNLTITGGCVIVNGPEDDGNGALDYSGTATISGGTVLAIGSSGMAQGFDTESSQGSFNQTLKTRMSQGTSISILDKNGVELYHGVSEKQFNNLVFSSGEMEKGETYTINVGSETYTATAK